MHLFKTSIRSILFRFTLIFFTLNLSQVQDMPNAYEVYNKVQSLLAERSYGEVHSLQSSQDSIVKQELHFFRVGKIDVSGKKIFCKQSTNYAV